MKYFRFKDQHEILKIEDRLFVHVQKNERDRIIETDEFGRDLTEIKVKPEPKPEVKPEVKPEDKSVVTPEQIAELTKPVDIKKNAVKGAYKQRQSKKA